MLYAASKGLQNPTNDSCKDSEVVCLDIKQLGLEGGGTKMLQRDLSNSNCKGLERPSSGNVHLESRLGNIWGATGGSFAGMVYDAQFLSPSLTTMGGGGRMPHVVIVYKQCTSNKRQRAVGSGVM